VTSRFKIGAPALGLPAFWVELWVAPPVPRVTIIKFDNLS
jgi:hypothetical protein